MQNAIWNLENKTTELIKMTKNIPLLAGALSELNERCHD